MLYLWSKAGVWAFHLHTNWQISIIIFVFCFFLNLCYAAHNPRLSAKVPCFLEWDKTSLPQNSHQGFRRSCYNEAIKMILFYYMCFCLPLCHCAGHVQWLLHLGFFFFLHSFVFILSFSFCKRMSLPLLLVSMSLPRTAWLVVFRGFSLWACVLVGRSIVWLSRAIQ